MSTLFGFMQVTDAQVDSLRELNFLRSLGVQFSYADTYTDDRIGKHTGFAGSLEFCLRERTLLNLQVGYFQTNRSLSWVEFQYKDYTYIAQRPQVWRNWSLNGLVLWQVTRNGFMGMGVGAEFIKVRRVSYNSAQVFWVDPLTDSPYVIPSTVVDQTEILVRPSLSFESCHESQLSRSLLLHVGLHYKLSFVGEKYGHTVLNTQNTYGISVGLKHRF